MQLSSLAGWSAGISLSSVRPSPRLDQYLSPCSAVPLSRLGTRRFTYGGLVSAVSSPRETRGSCPLRVAVDGVGFVGEARFSTAIRSSRLHRV